jgi:hypothetical protein
MPHPAAPFPTMTAPLMAISRFECPHSSGVVIPLIAPHPRLKTILLPFWGVLLWPHGAVTCLEADHARDTFPMAFKGAPGLMTRDLAFAPKANSNRAGWWANTFPQLTRNAFTIILEKSIHRRAQLLGFRHEIFAEGFSRETHGTVHHGC